MIQDKIIDVLTGGGKPRRVRKVATTVDVYIDRPGRSFSIQVNGKFIKAKNVDTPARIDKAVEDAVTETTKALTEKGKTYKVTHYEV